MVIGKKTVCFNVQLLPLNALNSYLCKSRARSEMTEMVSNIKEEAKLYWRETHILI